jgi:hypothetical protein
MGARRTNRHTIAELKIAVDCTIPDERGGDRV